MKDVRRIHIIVEGQTEETFVNKVLAPYLGAFETFLDARAVETSRRGDHRFRGGMTSYAKAKNDILTWLKADRNALVSTMFDFYRLPNDFPGYNSINKISSPKEKVEVLERSLNQDIGEKRFIPYLQLHEFETLLFSDPTTTASVLPGSIGDKLSQILVDHKGDPELINDGQQTAPSKRLERLCSRYDKVAYGSRVAQEIGIEKIREKCTHFRDWIEKLKNH